MYHIYYFFGLLFLIYEIHFLFSLQRQFNQLKINNEYLKANPGTKFQNMPESVQRYSIKMLLIGVPFFIWILAGLLTSQWPLFLVLLLVDFIFLGILRKIIKFSKPRIVIMGVSTILTMATILFATLNRYHLGIDIQEKFLEIISNLF